MVEWNTYVYKDVYCRDNEKIVECISKAYDYSLLHIPLVKEDKLLGLVDFYKLAGILGIVKDRFPELRCRDILRLSVSHVSVKQQTGFSTLISIIVDGKYTSLGVKSDPGDFTGTVMASDIASILVNSEEYFRDLRVRDVYSRRVGIISDSFPLTDILRIIAKRRQPCLIVFDGHDVSGILCLSDVLYLLSQFEVKPPIERMYADEFLKEAVKVDANTMLTDNTVLRDFKEPLLIIENEEVSGMLTALDVLDYAISKTLRSK